MARVTEAKKAAASRKLLQSDFANIRLLNDRFVFDARSGTFHRVSESAAFILVCMQCENDLARVVASYARRYSLPPAIAERDVENFLGDLIDVGRFAQQSLNGVVWSTSRSLHNNPAAPPQFSSRE